MPQHDKWFDGFATEWGKKNGVTVTVDHMAHLELAARAAAEVFAGAGHDIFSFNGWAARICTKNMLSISAVSSTRWRSKQGEVHQIGRQIGYNEVRSLEGRSDLLHLVPRPYRRDLWDEIGMKPDTWEDLRVAAAAEGEGHADWYRAWALRRPERFVPQHAVELWRC